ncbi:hypothetical protein [Arthrobacter sp. 7Tela_A1]|uniref:hypothetical protein n=1 Tax=Arthrobacter sp. 7Tela_A1 TaxID=3093745 RepID=UPI003BB5558C
MMAGVIGWVFPLGLVVYCGWVAFFAWTLSIPEKTRGAYLATLLEAGFVAVVMRLMVEWSPVTIWLWVLSAAALAAAVAGLVVRWPELPSRRGKATEPHADFPGVVPARKPGPGRVALTGYAALLAAAVAVSVMVG